MKFIKRFSFIFIFLSLAQLSQAQIKIFNADSVLFVNDLETYMNPITSTHKDVKDFIKLFIEKWKTPGFPHYCRLATYTISNEMLTRKIPSYPTYETFLSALLNFVNSGLSETQFDQWIASLEKLVKVRPYNNLNTYLTMSDNLFGNNNTMFKSPTISWSSSSNNFTFKSDSVPEVVFSKLNLKCTNERNDTIVIYGTQGVFYPNSGTWIGSHGKVDWTRTGLDANTVYGELVNYTIVCKQGGFVADSVIFWNKNYFDKSLTGKVIERNVSEPAGKETYPRFVSYGKRFAIPNLTPDVTYNGGFSMRGRRFVGSGTVEEPAQLIFKRKDKPFMVISSLEYGITKDQIMADDAAIVMHLTDTDSVYHPDVQMVYNITKKHLSLIRSDQGLSQTPYFDSYHKVNMFFEELTWNIDEPKIALRVLEGSAQSIADFESQDFFRPELFDKFTDNVSGTNTIMMLAQYSKAAGGNDFLVSDIASYMHTTSDEMRPSIFKLATIGLLGYDVLNDKIHVRPRLQAFISNKSRKLDYDVLDYHSENPGRGVDNGTLDLLSNDITLNGIKVIVVSDSENVYIYPKDQQVVLHRNRNSTFGGNVHAGRFDFYGKHFEFKYDDFKIKMNATDSIRILAESYDVDSRGQHHLVPVKSVIEHVSGEIALDQPFNKSGLKPYHQYPILTSDTNSFVYYNKKTVQNGVYKKDKFYFKLDPFVIDSLNRFTNAGLHFNGTLASADIMEDMRETLKLQPDYSLGFIHEAPADGLAIYGGKGKFYSKIKLSNSGLKGAGSINYITSVSKSNDFTFFPDSMNAAANFVVNEQKTQPEFPPVTGDSIYEHWVPKEDHMMIKDVKSPFLIYTGVNQSVFHGFLMLTPDLLSGNGEVDFLKANLNSKFISFKQHLFRADTADFALEAMDNSGIAFATNNMNSEIDFEKQMGQFKSNGGGSVVKFPENEYIAYMDEFKWYMQQDQLELSSSKTQKVQTQGKELQFAGAKFISTDSKQDSLQFIAPSARYSIKDFLITAHNVPFINVADAQIIPDSGKVLVHKSALMEPLVKAEITANTVTKYHHLYNADLSITSRKSYSGSGYYDYIDENKNKKAIYFSNIHVDTTHQTVANSTIADTAHFNLSPYFSYQGKVTLKATNPFLSFDGEARIIHECNELKIAWVRFTSQIDPNNVQIPIPGQAVNETNTPLASSPVLAVTDSLHMYGAFLSPLVNGKKDIALLPDSGYLAYDKPSQEYRIASKEKLIEQSLAGNYVSLNTRRCILYGEGNMNLGPDYGPVDMQTVGSVTDYLVPDSIDAKVMVLLNFFFDDGALDKMSTDFTNMGTLKPIDVSKGDVSKNLKQYLGKEEADKLISQLTLYGTAKKIPKELQSSLFFSQLSLHWNNQTRSYVSEGKIGVGSIGKTMVNKLCDGKIEFKKKRGADEINIYIELDPQHWYYFNYVNGFMQVLSSNNDFLNAISALKSDKREQKNDKGKYTFGVSTSNKKAIFLRKFTADADNGGGGN